MPLDVDVLAGLLRQRLSQAQAPGAPQPGLGSMSNAVSAPVPVPSAVAPAPVAPGSAAPVESDEQSLEKILARLFPDTDFEAEAEKRLARRGMTRPTGPGDFKPGWGHAIAALGPALGAVLGGQPAYAAGGAAAVLGGARGGWQEPQDEYLKKQEAYQKEAGAVVERMEARSERKAMAFLPLFAMSAAERARNKIDLKTLEIAAKDLDLRQQGVAIQLQMAALAKDAQAFDQKTRAAAQAFEEFKYLNPSAADKAILELNTKKAAWDKEYQQAQIAQQKNELAALIKHQRAMERISASKGPGESAMDQLKLAVILDKIKQGDMDGATRLMFGARASDDMTESDRLAIQQYISLAGKPQRKTGFTAEQIDGLRVRANAVMKRLGQSEFKAVPISDPGWFKQVLQGFFGF